MKEELIAQGVIYTDMETAVRDYPDLVKEHFMKCEFDFEIESATYDEIGELTNSVEGYSLRFKNKDIIFSTQDKTSPNSFLCSLTYFKCSELLKLLTR